MKIANVKMTKNRREKGAKTWSMRLPAAQQPLRGWLCTPASLTARLSEHYGAVTVQCWRSGWLLVNADEAACLRLPRRQRVWVRDVGLFAGGQLRVVAHTVVTLGRAQRMVARLGTRALGSVLFAQRSVRREPFAFAHLAWPQPLQRQLCQRLATSSTHRWWARRSVFLWQGGKILVTEIFLPPAG